MSLRSSGLRIPGAPFPLRHCERSEAIHSAASGEMDCFAALAMTAERACAFSRRDTPEVCIFFALLFVRGRREDRVRAAPAVSRANAHGKSAHEHTGSAETLRPSLRNGFTAYFELSPVNGFLATVAPEKLSLLLDLTPAPRRPDHTTSPYASATHVSRSSRVHRISPHVRDDGQRPSTGETGGVMPMIWPAR